MSIPYYQRYNCIYGSFANVTAHNDMCWFHINHYCKYLLLGIFWEQLNNVGRHFPSISTTYHYPFTFSVEMQSTICNGERIVLRR